MNKPNENKEIVTIKDEKWKEKNLELFKKALVEGINRRIDRELAEADDIPDPTLKQEVV